MLVWKIDRYGRSLKHLVNALADLSAYGVAFISFRDNLDLSTPSGRLMFQIIGAMAEFERSLIQERVAPACGMRGPRARSSEGPALRLTLLAWPALRGEGFSWSQVCRTLNVAREAPSDRSPPLSKSATPGLRKGCRRSRHPNLTLLRCRYLGVDASWHFGA